MNVPVVGAPGVNATGKLIPVKHAAPEICKVQDIPMQPFKIPNAGDLRGLYVLNDDVVWAGGTGGTIAVTKNGGDNWTVNRLTSIEGLDFRAVWALSDREACVMSVGTAEKGLACIFRTEDAGISWKRVFTDNHSGVFLNAMSFWDGSSGITISDPVNDEFFLYSTDNGGLSWNRLKPHSLPRALPGEALFAASNSCLTIHGMNDVWFATGGGATARVFHSGDRGLNWEAYETPIKPTGSSSGIFSLAFRNAKEGIAVGGDYKASLNFPGKNMIITHDAGRTWDSVEQKELSGIYFSSVAWTSEKEAKALVVEGGLKTFNTIVPGSRYMWAVGPGGACARILK